MGKLGVEKMAKGLAERLRSEQGPCDAQVST